MNWAYQEVELNFLIHVDISVKFIYIRPSQTVPKKRERTSKVRSRSPFGTEKTKNKKTNPA